MDAVGQAPLRRLTPTEYRNSVRDLFPGADLPSATLANDVTVRGFDNNAGGQAVSALLVEQYDTAAAEIARRAVEQFDAWAPCSLEAGSEDDREGCAMETARGIAARAYRRPLDSVETARFDSFVRDNWQNFGFDAAVRMFLHGILASPAFLYRPEFGVGSETGPTRALNGYELASRLSYFLWRTLPDEALLEAAGDGNLASDDALAAEAERMLEDPRARQTISDFHTQWLELRRLDSVGLDPEQFPELAEVRDDMRRSALAFVDHHFWEGTLQSLFTASEGFVNDRLAPLLDVAPPGSESLVRTPLDPSQRAGILTQPGVLTSTSHGMTHSPILRGVTVLRNVMCTNMPAPPPDITPALPDAIPGEAVTTRERIEQTHGTGECSGCHDLIDPVGFTFENYDALGRYQATENGVPVDASGEVTQSGDMDGQYDSAVELSQAFAESQRVRDCVATQWFRYALGRDETQSDVCQLQSLGEGLAEAGDMKALLVQLVTSPAFRRLPALAAH